MSKHALLSPSSASRWLICPGSVGLSKDIPDTASEYAQEGTNAHTLAAYCLNDKNDAKKHVGKIYAEDDSKENDKCFTVGEEQASYVQVYLDYVRREAKGKKLLVEQRLPLTPLTGEEDAFGTADAVIIDKDFLGITDLKFGIGVKIFAEKNKQLLSYLSAARHEFSIFGDFKKFKVAIVQPRLDWIDEWEISLEELDAFEREVKAVAPSALGGTGELNPSEDACRFCRAKAKCPALAKLLVEFSETAFDNLDKEPEIEISRLMSLTGLIEDGIAAVRAETERRLVSGIKVPGWKLVSGRMGARQWADAKEAETVMRDLKLPADIMYKSTLVSPTQAEKALAKTPEKWNSLQALITQKQGAPSVAPSTDPREELGAVVDSFENLGDAA